MRRYLVVAHRTLGGAHLMEHLHRLREEDPYCRFHLVVPRHHAATGPILEAEQMEAARVVLNEVLDQMAAMGIGATGAVGDANPVIAVDEAIRREGESNITGIIVSTFPPSSSAWLRRAVPELIARSFPLLAVTHVVAEEAVV